MVTYLVLDLESRAHYVGSSIGVKRPYRHLSAPTNFHLKRAKRKQHPMWVFVSVDDGLESREEEQYYLDFYVGSRWSMNINPEASANSTALEEYNLKVKRGELEHSNKNGYWRGPKDVNQQRLEAGTHNLLKENVDPGVLERRIKSVKAALALNNPTHLGVAALKGAKWEDPDHPELGRHHYNRLVKLQKQNGYPHTKENRIRVL